MSWLKEGVEKGLGAGWGLMECSAQAATAPSRRVVKIQRRFWKWRTVAGSLPILDFWGKQKNLKAVKEGIANT